MKPASEASVRTYNQQFCNGTHISRMTESINSEDSAVVKALPIVTLKVTIALLRSANFQAQNFCKWKQVFALLVKVFLVLNTYYTA